MNYYSSGKFSTLHPQKKIAAPYLYSAAIYFSIFNIQYQSILSSCTHFPKSGYLSNYCVLSTNFTGHLFCISFYLQNRNAPPTFIYNSGRIWHLQHIYGPNYFLPIIILFPPIANRWVGNIPREVWINSFYIYFLITPDERIVYTNLFRCFSNI